MGIEQTNLNKYISSSGFCSRRDADKLIEQARVTVNGELSLPGARINPGDLVEVDGEPVKRKTTNRPIYIAFNKPVGVTSTTDVSDKSNIIYFIGHPKRIFPVGRLDKDSDGLIFLTNDGDIVNKILRASNRHEKEYVVTVDKAITPEFVREMSNGVPVDGKTTMPCFVRQEGGRRFRIILTQGLNRQIRKMCGYLGFSVVSLTRVRIMHVELAGLPVGKWRYFTIPEIDKMNQMVAESSKTDTGDEAKRGGTKKDKETNEEGGRPVQYIPRRKKTGRAGEGAEGRELKPEKAAKQAVSTPKKERPKRPSKVMGEKGRGSGGSKYTDFKKKKGR